MRPGYWIPALVVALIALTVVYPWLMLVVAVAAIGFIHEGRDRIQRKMALRAVHGRELVLAQRDLERYSNRVTTDEVQNAMNSVLTAIKAENRTAHEVDLDTHNPTAVIRQRRESGALYVPLGTCECAAYPRPHRHAGTNKVRQPASLGQIARMSPEQRAEYKRNKPEPPKPCTEGGPCKIGHRRVVHDVRGVRVASLCTKCWKHEYWQPFLDLGAS
jgi:hypothetical protein